MKNTRLIPILLLGLWLNSLAHAEQTLLAPKVEHPPVIDGKSGDPAWSHATTITTQDRVADIPLELQAVHDGSRLYMRVRFPDSSENRDHKKLIWNKDLELYRVGPKREDSLVLKWNMQPFPADISLAAPQTYKADIWYWKSARTDHAGYADDKHQIYSDVVLRKAQRLVGSNGQTFYLVRRGDAGRSAYKARVIVDYNGDEIHGMDYRQPQGSRADIKAKGHWQDGYWTIEFARALDTGHNDDVAIQKGKSAQFGISRFEIAGRQPNPAMDEPLFGSGEIGETLFLQLQ